MIYNPCNRCTGLSYRAGQLAPVDAILTSPPEDRRLGNAHGRGNLRDSSAERTCSTTIDRNCDAYARGIDPPRFSDRRQSHNANPTIGGQITSTKSLTFQVESGTSEGRMARTGGHEESLGAREHAQKTLASTIGETLSERR